MRDAAGDARPTIRSFIAGAADRRKTQARLRVFAGGFFVPANDGLPAGNHPGKAALAQGDLADLRQLGSAARTAPRSPRTSRTRPAIGRPSAPAADSSRSAKWHRPCSGSVASMRDGLLQTTATSRCKRLGSVSAAAVRCASRALARAGPGRRSRPSSAARGATRPSPCNAPARPTRPRDRRCPAPRRASRCSARNHLVLGGIDHQHLAGPGPIAERGGEPQRIDRRDLRFHVRPSARAAACASISLERPGFAGVMDDRQEIAAGEDQARPMEPRLGRRRPWRR